MRLAYEATVVLEGWDAALANELLNKGYTPYVEFILPADPGGPIVILLSRNHPQQKPPVVPAP